MRDFEEHFKDMVKTQLYPYMNKKDFEEQYLELLEGAEFRLLKDGVKKMIKGAMSSAQKNVDK